MEPQDEDKLIRQYETELVQELDSILSYWMQHSIDQQQGGFFGAIDNNNIADPHASKGLVLNCRILWTLSAALRFDHPECKPIAERAFQYIVDHFIDLEFGGAFWTLDAAGKIADGRKQIYGLAFCIYGMTEFYKHTQNEKAIQISKDLYQLIEQYSFDETRGGYFEAFTRDWKELPDQRLSEKDPNEPKTMNTHLHILEAYTNLYRIWPNAKLYSSVIFLLNNFIDHILNLETGHLNLYFDVNWDIKGNTISYGHDIEAAWLLLEAAEVIRDNPLMERLKLNALKLADAVEYGFDADGGLWYELVNGELVKEKHSWPQAEAMVGFFNAWEISGDKKYLDRSLQSWAFVKKYIRDSVRGEWFWGVNEEHQPIPGVDKVGLWKCPYHNARACMEIVSRIRARND